MTAGKAGASLTPEMIRSWLRAIPAFDRLIVAIDPQATQRDLAKLLSDGGKAPVDAGFAVTGGGITITPSETGTACCAPGAVALVDRALREPLPTGQALSLRSRSSNPSETMLTHASLESRRLWARSPRDTLQANLACQTSTRWPTTCGVR